MLDVREVHACLEVTECVNIASSKRPLAAELHASDPRFILNIVKAKVNDRCVIDWSTSGRLVAAHYSKNVIHRVVINRLIETLVLIN